MQDNKYTVLYADDNDFTRESVTLLLECFCPNVISAKDGSEALELYFKYKPDIIVADINMPKMNGLEFIENVRKTDEEVVIIIISAYSDNDKLFKAIEIGIDKYLLKPVTQNILDNTFQYIFTKLQKIDTKAYEHLAEAIVLIESSSFNVKYANSSYLRLFGYSNLSDIEGKDFKKFFLNSNDIDKISTSKEYQTYLKSKDNKHILVKIHTQEVIYNKKQYYLISIIDVSDIVRDAAKDTLTNLYTRQTLQYDFHNFLQQQNAKDFGAIFVDIDNFKFINDSLGHQFGDKVIQKVAEILKSSIRKNDLVIRWGGDEFLILLMDVTLHKTKHIAENIRVEINNMELGGYSDFTCSFGVDIIKNNDTLDNIINRIDKALLRAKQFSKNCVIHYTKDNIPKADISHNCHI